MQNNNDSWQDIGGMYVKIDDSHRFGTDAVLLENFANALKKDIVCDIGTGCGIMPVLMARDNKAKKIYGIEIQKSAFNLAKEAVIKNGLAEKFEPLNLDAKNFNEIDKIINTGSLDLIVSNPPYYKENSGGDYPEEERAACREESSLNIYDVCEFAKRYLKYGGRLCVCFKPQRLCDCVDAMRKNQIEPKKIRLIYTDIDKNPWLVLVEGKRGAKAFLDILPPLVMNSDEGRKELTEIYKYYSKL